MGKLDLSLLKGTPRKGINIPDSEIQKAIKAVEKKEAQEKTIEKKIKSLDKLVEKTDKMIERAKKKKEKKANNTVITKPSNNHITVITQSIDNHNSLSCSPSYLDYQMMGRLPKKVMTCILEEHKNQEVQKDDLFVIDTEEIKQKTGKSPNQIANTIMRLKDKGYISVERSSNSGTRAIRINISLFDK